MSGCVVAGVATARGAARACAIRSRLAGVGAIVCANASFGGACPLPPPMTPAVAAGCATRGGGADEIGAGALRGMPAGGVGVTTGDDGCGIAAIVEATPIVCTPIGCAAEAAGTFAGPEPAAVIGCAGALRTDCGAAAPGDCDVR